MAGDPRRAAGYIRVSQERAARNGYGLGAQETDIKRFALFKQWELVGIYREEGVSGYLKERPALNKLLVEAKGLGLGAVIFPSIDRAGRSVKDVIDIDRALRAEGVNTVFLRENIDTSTPTGQLFRNIMASLAQFEGRVICERLHKGLKRKGSEGKYRGGWIAYGYRRTHDGTITVVPEEAAVVERIFRRAAEGRSLPAIAKALREEKAPTRNGGGWRPSTIQGMLRNRFYTGRVELDGDLVRARHDAIVSNVLFRRSRKQDA
ncbi:MAG: recombinase family protein [Acidobacteriota bacterium]